MTQVLQMLFPQLASALSRMYSTRPSYCIIFSFSLIIYWKHQLFSNGQKMNDADKKIKLIKCQCCPHIETSQLICTANQLTGFSMRATLAFNGLIHNGNLSDQPVYTLLKHIQWKFSDHFGENAFAIMMDGFRFEIAMLHALVLLLFPVWPVII